MTWKLRHLLFAGIALAICATLLLALVLASPPTAKHGSARTDLSAQRSSSHQSAIVRREALPEAAADEAAAVVVVQDPVGAVLPDFSVLFGRTAARTDDRGRVAATAGAQAIVLAQPGYIVESYAVAPEEGAMSAVAHSASALRGVVRGIPESGAVPSLQVVLHPNRKEAESLVYAGSLVQKRSPTIVHADGTFHGYNLFRSPSKAVLTHSDAAPSSKIRSLVVATKDVEPETRWLEFDLSGSDRAPLASVAARLHFSADFPYTGTADLEFLHLATGREVVDIQFERARSQETVEIQLGMVPTGVSLVGLMWDDPVRSISCASMEVTPILNGVISIDIHVPNPGTVTAQFPGCDFSVASEWDYSILLRDPSGRPVERLYPRRLAGNTIEGGLVAAGTYYVQGLGPGCASSPKAVQVRSDRETFVSLFCEPAFKLEVVVGRSEGYRTVGLCDSMGAELTANFVIPRQEATTFVLPRGRYVVSLGEDARTAVELIQDTSVDIR